MATRSVRFDDVPDVLRLIHRAVESGCRDHYDARQRSVVCATYTSTLFVEALGPFDTVVAVEAGGIVGVAQLDAPGCRLRALFIDAHAQGRGLGAALLGDVETRAWARGCRRLQGAMAINAVPFYQRAGFRVCDGAQTLTTAAIAVPVVRMEKQLGGDERRRSPEGGGTTAAGRR